MGPQWGVRHCLLRHSEGLIPTAPNHPRSIGTCSIGIQVTKGWGGHKMAVSVIGNGKRGWTLGVSCCFVVFFAPLPPTLGTEGHANENNRHIVQQQKYHNYRRCSDWFKAKRREDSVVTGCTLTDSQRAIRCCVCSRHQSLISLEESAPIQHFTETKGRAVGVKLLSHLKVGDFFCSGPLLSSHLSLSKAFMAVS